MDTNDLDDLRRVIDVPDKCAAEPEAPDESSVMLVAPVVDEPSALTKDQVRSRRRRDVGSRSILLRTRKADALSLTRAVDPELEASRPKSRADCKGGIRPCPFVLCKHNLYLDVSARTGSIKLNFPDVEVEDMKESCSLDVADRGGGKIEELAEIMNLTRERIRQLGVGALEKLFGDLDAEDYFEKGASPQRILPDGKRHLALFSQDFSQDLSQERESDVEEDDSEVCEEPPVDVQKASCG